MKKFVALLLVIVILFNSGCASVFGGHIDECQRIKGKSGTPTREIRVAALICDILLGGLIAVGIDFATNAIYIPCEAYPNHTGSMSETQTLTDAYGNKIGEIDDRGNELILYDKDGNKKGSYDKVKNVTYDATGKKVGEGNTLAMLLK